MKSTPEPTDRAPVLGAPIRPATPAPAPVHHAPGILRAPDGRLETQIPLPRSSR